MSVKFIRASNIQKHIDAIHTIVYRCGQDMYAKDGLTHWRNGYPKENIEKDIIEKEVYLVAKEDEYIGCFMISTNPSGFFTDTDKHQYIYISKVAIDPKVAGQGIGSLSIDFCKGLVKEKQLKGIRLDVYNKSVKAIKFYEKLGFIRGEVKPTRNFEVLCMEKVVEGAGKQ